MTETLAGTAVEIGTPAEIVWTADVGPNRTLGELNEYLGDVQTIIDLGEAWGVVFGTRAARWLTSWDRSTVVTSSPGDPTFAAEVLRVMGTHASPMSAGFAFTADPWEFGQRPAYIVRPGEEPVQAVIDLTGSAHAARWSSNPDDVLLELLGPAPVISSITYSNPIVFVIPAIAVGAIITGVLAAIRLTRDWRSDRRKGRAEARAAEANAGIAEKKLEAVSWMVEEAKAGRIPVSASDLIGLVKEPQIRALDAVASKPLEIESRAVSN